MNIAGHKAVVTERDDGVIEIEVALTVFDVVCVSYKVADHEDPDCIRSQAVEFLTRIVSMPLKEIRDASSRYKAERA